ncbi:hypothetical protein [Amycolatopsis sacchari]|uniref:hypothetical protein n=1 Tax=Amycolatopsis sacchari TaxID=115433 RepID=UPI003D74D730
MGDRQNEREQVAEAVAELFPAEVAEAIGDDEAFGALVYRVRERMRAYGRTAAAVLGEVDAGDREFAGRASEPAAFLAAKVRDLPKPGAAAATAEGAETSGNTPREVVEVIQAVRVFTGTAERIGVEQFGDQVAAALDAGQLAWVIDRLDDVRGAVAELLAELATSVAASGGDGYEFEDTVNSLRSAGDGLYAAMQEIDPDGERHNIVGHL